MSWYCVPFTIIKGNPPSAGSHPPTALLSVWQNTSLPPACFWLCTRRAPSQRVSDQPRPENRVRPRAAAPTPCWGLTAAGRYEATPPLAEGTLGLRKMSPHKQNQPLT